MFKYNDTPYDARATKLEQPLRRTTNYGLRTFSNIGSRLLNLLIQEYTEVLHMDLGQFKSLLKQWTGPECDFFLNIFTLSVLHDVIICDLHTDIYFIVHLLNMHCVY